MKAPRRSCVVCGRVIKDGSYCDLHDTRGQYDDPAYRTHRELALVRDGMRCVACGSYGPLEVDHVVPLSQGGGNDLDNLQVMCRSCHRAKTQADQGMHGL